MAVSESHINVYLNLEQGQVFARIWNGGRDLAGQVPIIMLHESLGSVEQWHDFPHHLAVASGRPVMAYDRLGFGRSSPYSQPWNFDFIAQEARIYFPQIKTGLNIDNFVVFGHSVGAGMAVNIAAAYPDNCRALITESAQAFVDKTIVEGIEQAKRQFAQQHTLKQLSRYHGDKTQWIFHVWTDTWQAPGFGAWSLDTVLPQVVCPTLVVNGELDQYCSYEHPRRIASLVQGPVQLELLKGLGHIPHKENANLIIELTSDFLDRYRSYIDR